MVPPLGIGAHVGPGSVGGVGSEMGQETATPLRLVVGAVPKLTKLKIQEETLKQTQHWTQSNWHITLHGGLQRDHILSVYNTNS